MVCVLRLYYLFPQGLWEAPDPIDTFLDSSLGKTPFQSLVVCPTKGTQTQTQDPDIRVLSQRACSALHHPPLSFDVSQKSGALLELAHHHSFFSPFARTADGPQ